MARLPKPLIGLLLGTVAFFAVWMVALKPSASSPGGSPTGVGQYQSAINQAHQAVKTSNAANAKLGAPTATVKAAPTATVKAAPAQPATHAGAAKPANAHKTAAAKPAPVHVQKSAAVAKPVAPSVASELSTLQNALATRRVVAVLFYNPASADDQAMKQELAAVPTHHGEVVTLAVPVSELTQFAAITAQIPVVTAPTLILIDPARHATTMTGYGSQLELDQRVADALAVK